MTDKPSRNEEEYFAREEAARLKQSRAGVHRAAIEEERKSHSMKCPKCGTDLKTVDHHVHRLDFETSALQIQVQAGWISDVDAERGSVTDGPSSRTLGDEPTVVEAK